MYNSNCIIKHNMKASRYNNFRQQKYFRLRMTQNYNDYNMGPEAEGQFFLKLFLVLYDWPPLFFRYYYFLTVTPPRRKFWLSLTDTLEWSLLDDELVVSIWRLITCEYKLDGYRWLTCSWFPHDQVFRAVRVHHLLAHTRWVTIHVKSWWAIHLASVISC